MAIKSKTHSKPTAPAKGMLAQSANGATPAAVVEQILAAIDTLPKGSDELKKVRNKIYSRIARKEPDPEIKKVLDEIVGLKSFAALKLAYLAVRKEQPKADVETVEAQS